MASGEATADAFGDGTSSPSMLLALQCAREHLRGDKQFIEQVIQRGMHRTKKGAVEYSTNKGGSGPRVIEFDARFHRQIDFETKSAAGRAIAAMGPYTVDSTLQLLLESTLHSANITQNLALPDVVEIAVATAAKEETESAIHKAITQAIQGEQQEIAQERAAQ